MDYGIHCGSRDSLNEFFDLGLIQLHGMLDIEGDNLLLMNEEIVLLSELALNFLQIPFLEDVCYDEGAALSQLGVGTLQKGIYI